MARVAVVIGAVVASVASAAACGAGAGDSAGADARAADAIDARPVDVAPTALAIGRDGELAALDLAAPWAVRARADLALPVASVRYHRGRFYVVHPAPANRVSVVTADDLTVEDPILLPPGADPRDLAFTGDDSAVISLRGAPSLAVVWIASRALATPIDLAPFADAAVGLAAGMLARCGDAVYVQLQRPTTPGLGVVTLDGAGGGTATRVIPTAHPPAFAMPADCPDALYVAEPMPLFEGGGAYERIALATSTPVSLPFADGTGEVGGFAMIDATRGWFIVHTEFGPAPSSHLSLLPDHGSVWNTFAEAHVDRLALDRESDQLFYPDACTEHCIAPAEAGVQVFDALTATQLSPASGIAVGFPPVDVVIAR
jgi:hypothetical protein